MFGPNPSCTEKCTDPGGNDYRPHLRWVAGGLGSHRDYIFMARSRSLSGPSVSDSGFKRCGGWNHVGGLDVFAGQPGGGSHLRLFKPENHLYRITMNQTVSETLDKSDVRHKRFEARVRYIKDSYVLWRRNYLMMIGTFIILFLVIVTIL